MSRFIRLNLKGDRLVGTEILDVSTRLRHDPPQQAEIGS
jgi:hypothetical protein